MGDTWKDVQSVAAADTEIQDGHQENLFVRSVGQHWNKQGICRILSPGNLQDSTI